MGKKWRSEKDSKPKSMYRKDNHGNYYLGSTRFTPISIILACALGAIFGMIGISLLFNFLGGVD